MSKKRGNIFVWIILAALAVGLTGFGIGGIGGGAGQTVASVGDEKVSAISYYRALNQRLQVLSRQFGQQVSFELARSLGEDQRLLGQLLSNATLDHETTNLGLSVGDTILQEQLLANPSFAGSDGTFSKTQYDYALTQAGLRPSEYEAILRKEISRDLLQGSVAGGVSTSETMSVHLLRFLRETRSFDWLKLTRENLKAPLADPTGTELQSWYDAHLDVYMSPQSREITYVHLSPDMIADTIKIDDAKLQASFDLQSDRYNQPARLAVERLVYPTKEAAAIAIAEFEAGNLTFEGMMSARRVTRSDIDLGEVETGDVSSEAAKLLFAATEPGVVGPVNSKLGPAIFRINAILDAQTTSFESVRKEIKAELLGEAARRQALEMMEDLDDHLAGGSTLEDLAAETDMILGKISLPRDASQDMSGYEAFRKAAAAATTQDFPELTILSDGGVFALRLDQIVEPAQIPFEKARDQVLGDVTRDQLTSALTKLGDEMVARLRTGGTEADLGITFSPAEDVARDGFVENTPPALLIEVFALDKDGVALVPDTDGVILAKLTTITDFDDGAAENIDLVANVQTQINSQLSNEILQSYVTALQSQTGITIDQSALNAVHSQIQ